MVVESTKVPKYKNSELLLVGCLSFGGLGGRPALLPLDEALNTELDAVVVVSDLDILSLSP